MQKLEKLQINRETLLPLNEEQSEAVHGAYSVLGMCNTRPASVCICTVAGCHISIVTQI